MHRSKNASLGFLAVFVALYLGCLSCYWLQTGFGCSAILAASLLGVAVTYVPTPRVIDRHYFQVVFCIGTFAAMSSRELLAEPWHVFAVSLIGAGVAFLARPHFAGLGGKMGMLAFISTAIWIFLRVWVR